MRILLVEEHSRARGDLRVLLDEEGHTVVTAGSGAEALVRFRSEPCPVVLADLDLPGMDGETLCRRIRSQAGAPYAYFILLVPPEALREAFDTEADDELRRPVEPAHLLARLRVAARVARQAGALEALQGQIPICGTCHRIHRHQGGWQRLDEYIASHSRVTFDPVLCPECMEREFGEALRARHMGSSPLALGRD